MKETREKVWTAAGRGIPLKPQVKIQIKKAVKNCRLLCLLSGMIALTMNYFCRTDDSNALIWILAPTARWAGILGDITFEYVPPQGYVNHFHQFLLAPSCSGVRFMLLTFLMLVFSFLPSAALRADDKDMQKEYLWFGFSIVFSYVSTIFVNGIRITASIYIPDILERRRLMDGRLTPDRVHTLIGTALYFTFLCLIYLCAAGIRRRIFCRNVLPDERSAPLPRGGYFVRRAAGGGLLAPVFWYLLIVLALPFLKRMYLDEWEGFGQYAALVIGVCLTVFMAFTVFRKPSGIRNRRPDRHAP